VPKSYDDFKRNLKENQEEIKLTGSSKTFWEYLAKLVGEKKANQRREEAIERLSKVKCTTRNGSIIVTTKKELEKRNK
jgi:hypothetical protein